MHLQREQMAYLAHRKETVLTLLNKDQLRLIQVQNTSALIGTE
jgi:hypothetical protein